QASFAVGLLASQVKLEWTQLGTGLPNAQVWDMHYTAPLTIDGTSFGDVLVVGTFGRGAWKIRGVMASLGTNTLTVSGTTTGAAQVSEIRLVREAGNPALLDVFIAGKKIITTPQATVGLLNITGGAGNENLVLDVSQGLISMPGGISFDGGGGTNSATVTGNTRVTDGTTTTDLTSGLVTRSSLSAGFENQSLFLVN